MVWWLAGIVCALLLYIAQFAVILWADHRRPAQMTAWLLFALVLPYIGFIAYLIIGKDFTRRRLVRKLNEQDRSESSKESALPDDLQHINMIKLDRLSPFPITDGNKVKVLTDGIATFDTILEELNKAQHHIHLDYYTIRDDRIGRRFLKVLTEKARNGVEVRVVYDGIGSMDLTDQYIKELKAAGVRVAAFLPPRIAFVDRRLNYRNHRKIIVIDGIVGFLGGINIGTEYVGGNKQLGFWRDTHLQLKGPSVKYLQILMIKDWAFAADEQLSMERYCAFSKSLDEGERVLIVPSSPGRSQRYIRDVVFSAITSAKSRIYVTTPYFIPDQGIRMALRTAALSGIDVRLIIPGVPDSKLVLMATLSYIEEMLDAGVKVYRYEKGFIHAKVLIIDDLIASVGTANMDMRSLNSNFEINAFLFEQSTIERLERDFISDMNNSRELELSSFVRRSRKQKVAESIAHMLSPLL